MAANILTKSTEDIEKMLDSELILLKENIIKAHEQAGQKTTGRTVAMLEEHVLGMSGELLGAPWTFTLERGRGAAQGGSSNGAFLQALKEWIVAKGLEFKDEKDLHRLANFLRWRINTVGTRLFQSGGRKDIFTPAIEEFGNNITEKVGSIYSEEILSVL
jgi:hypothetical protein